MTVQRERRGVFGEAAGDHEARQGYPAELVDDVVAAAGPGPALEAGAAVVDVRLGDLAVARRV